VLFGMPAMRLPDGVAGSVNQNARDNIGKAAWNEALAAFLSGISKCEIA